MYGPVKEKRECRIKYSQELSHYYLPTDIIRKFAVGKAPEKKMDNKEMPPKIMDFKLK